MKNNKKIVRKIVAFILATCMMAGIIAVAPAQKAEAKSNSFVYMYEVTNNTSNFWFWQSSSITVKNNTNSTIYISVIDTRTYQDKVVGKALKPGKTYKYSFKSGTYRIAAASSYWGGFAPLGLSSYSRVNYPKSFTAY